MELMILNESLEQIGYIDEFESLIWNERYFECGDFELLTYPSPNNIVAAVQGYYAAIEESDHLMIIEDVNIITDPVEGNKLFVKGRSIEIILDRRIIWNPIIFENVSFQDCIFALLDENVLNPSDSARKISLVEFEASTDPNILELMVSNQYWGDSLYTTIIDLCVLNSVGFKLTLTDQNKFLFKLYIGADRSYEQTQNPYVVFTPNFENLKNSTYTSTDKHLKTASLTIGEKGIGNAPVAVEVLINDAEDILRREMVLDAQDVSSVDQNGDPISEEEYIEHLYQKGREELSKRTIIKSFSSEVDPTGTFIYGEDFFLGDIVQISNEYGIENRSRMIEIVRIQDKSGSYLYPVFNIAASRVSVYENITLGKVLNIEIEPQSSIYFGKSLGISFDSEVAEKIYEAVGFTKRLNIFVQVYEDITLNKIIGLNTESEKN